jgi:hypothetical protein
MARPNSEFLPLVVRPGAARTLLGNCGTERLYGLLNSGELEGFVDGRARWIVVASIHRYIANRLAASGGSPATTPATNAPRRRGQPRNGIADSHPDAGGTPELAPAAELRSAPLVAAQKQRCRPGDAMKPSRYVLTRAIREAVSGREIEILSALGIRWNGSSAHIRCPYLDHDDMHPSWRWDHAKKRAHCTCASSTSILDVIAKVKGIDFEAAKIAAAEMIGRNDLIRHTGRKTYQRADAASLLNPAPENRDDELIRCYLGDRLGVEPNRVMLPTTNVVGHQSLGYFDPPRSKGGKFVHVGDYPAAVFETVDRDGNQHAHRIYLAPGGRPRQI